MSAERRRGLLRLGILVVSILGLIVLGISVTRGGSGSSSGAAARSGPPPARLTATELPARLPVALHGLAAARLVNGLLLVGGADSADRSRSSVYRFDPKGPNGGTMTTYGSLSQPLHDAAAATVNRETLVFGGGNTSTLDTVQALAPGGVATPVGRLPDQLSDLSALTVGQAAYILGGFNGNSPSASVFQTTDGRTFTRVARLPTPVRYAAVAAIQDKIYVFGGELANGQDTNLIQEYDIATERAVVAGHLIEPVSHASAVTLDGGIYLLGGRRIGAASDRILRFDPTRNLALPAGRLPAPVFDGAARTFGTHAYLVGGLGRNGSALDTVISLR
ncbi:MAG: Kelch repeat-containing protein [Solirubrobacterales bacterium]